MWDIFNNKKVKALREELDRRDSDLEKTKSSLKALESDLVGLKNEKERLIEQFEIQKEALNEILKEFKEFIIQNRQKGLSYGNLKSTRELVNGIADVHEYIVDLKIQFINSSLRAFRRRLIIMLDLLKTESKIVSFYFEFDHPVIMDRRTEAYKAVVIIYSNLKAQTIENIFLEFMYDRRVVIEENSILDGKKIAVKGSIRESYF